MRLDAFLSNLAIIKRRTVAKELADGGHIKVNDRRAKPAHKLKVGDIVEITGQRHLKFRIRELPYKSVPKQNRPDYYELLIDEKPKDIFGRANGSI